jgi:phosphoribosylanthranilate isomerase
MERLRGLLPANVELMKAIPVDGLDSINLARRFASVSDYLLLDSLVSGRSGVGASGRTHDWNISRRIVEALGDRTRVILAGGLNPDNVRAAVEATRPWGVDSYTGTNVKGDPLRKDRDLVVRFIEQARV